MNGETKILVIDDDESMRDSCEQLFAGQGSAVETAENGDIGLQKHADLGPDVVLLDLKMPGKSGLEVLRELRRTDPGCTVIVITGFGTIETAVEAMKIGAYDFISKPFTPEEIRIVVNRALEWRRTIREADRLRREKEEMRRNFVSMVSHELKSPLAAAVQNLMALNSGAVGTLPDRARDILGRLEIRIQGLLALIRDWLDLSRIESGEMVDGMEPVQLSGIIEDTVDTLQPLADASHVKLTFRKPEHVPSVQGHPGTLRMLMTNLVHNGIKYNLDPGAVEIGLEAMNGGVDIVVRDTGVGIPGEELPRIFEQFYRTRESRGEEGSGLGLSIVKRIVDAHHGSITVKSRVGRGTSFRIHLPSDEEAA